MASHPVPLPLHYARGDVAMILRRIYLRMDPKRPLYYRELSN
jgi:hypothetical protein